MLIRTAGQGRTGAPFYRAALCVCCILAALLLVFSSAAAETVPSWEERMTAAREKYNEKTVNVYVRGKGWNRSGKINVCFYRVGKKYIAVCIRESLQITDEAEMEAVLEVMAKHEYYSEEVYGSISFLKAQWIAHNLAYGMATGTEEQQALAGMIVGKGSREIIRHAKQLDLTPISEIPEEQLSVYEFVEYVYCENE